MKKSRYNYVSEWNEKYIIYNGIKGTCVILDKLEYALFDSISRKNVFYEEYCRLGFYVEEDIDEISVFLNSAKVAHEKNSSLYYRIYTTTACNANCYYCYEQGMNRSTMTFDEADEIYDFILQKYSGEHEIGIEWFGGEPLLNINIIDYLSDKLVEFEDQKGCKYWSRMVTNGLLVDRLSLEKVARWHLSHVQITLDGRKEFYERVKNFTIPDSFDIVIDNIKRLLDWNVKVTVRLNYSESNVQEVIELIYYLGGIFRNSPNLKIYGKHILEKQLDNSAMSSENTDIEVFDACLKNGFISDILKTINRRDLGCVANNNKAFMILPNGNIGKCSQAIADGMLIGSVSNGIDILEERKWIRNELPYKCYECNLLPLCNGGCIYEYMEGKNPCMISSKVLDYKLKKYLEEKASYL